MRPRETADPAEVDPEAARRAIRMLQVRAGVYAVQARRRGHPSGAWWREVSHRLAELRSAEVPDLAEAKRCFRSGYRITDGQAS